jgi:hypothetical protein
MKLRHLYTLVTGSLLALALVAPACTAEVPAPEEVGAAAEAATATRIYASEGALDLSFETLGTFEQRDGVRALILHATANRYLANVFSFVPDDAFGQANIISERRLEVVLHEGYELNTILSGMPLFVTVDTFTGTPNHYVARVDLGARFYDFLGSSAIWIDEQVDPFWVLNGTDNISYRGKVDALASSLTVTAPDGAPAVTRLDADSFRLDWSYAGLHDAVDPHTQYLSFAADLQSGTLAKKTARLVVRVVGLGLTAGDPYEVWPTPDCDPAVYTCIHAQPAGTTDYATCGTYREVARCYYASGCQVLPPEPLSLAPIDETPLDPAIEAWNLAQGPSGFVWSHISGVAAYDTPECPAVPPTIQAVVEKLAEADQNQPPAEDGTITDRAGLLQSFFFGGAGGSALLAAVDAFAGGGEVQAWLYESEIRCHNCHDFLARAVLFYPQSGVVLVLVGNHGYDS